MKLKFYAREDALATVPGFRAGVGQPMSYIGRSFKSPGMYPANKDTHVVDSESVSVSELHRYLDHGRRGHVWCADEATARECNAEYVAVEFKDGAWLRKQSKEAK